MVFLITQNTKAFYVQYFIKQLTQWLLKKRTNRHFFHLIISVTLKNTKESRLLNLINFTHKILCSQPTLCYLLFCQMTTDRPIVFFVIFALCLVMLLGYVMLCFQLTINNFRYSLMSARAAIFSHFEAGRKFTEFSRINKNVLENKRRINSRMKTIQNLFPTNIYL